MGVGVAVGVGVGVAALSENPDAASDAAEVLGVTEEAAVVAEAVSEGLGIVDDAASEVTTTTTPTIMHRRQFMPP